MNDAPEAVALAGLALRVFLVGSAAYLTLLVAASVVVRLSSRPPRAVRLLATITFGRTTRRVVTLIVGAGMALPTPAWAEGTTTSTPTEPALVLRRLPEQPEAPAPIPAAVEAAPETPEPPPPPVAPVADAATITWTVAPGEHLWLIAERVVEATSGRAPSDAEVAPFWRRLVEENRARLVDPENPDLIRPGQVFVVPAL